MGQIGEKCSCLYDKTEKTTYNFEQESGNKPSSNSNKNFNAKNFLNAKVRSGSLIKSPTVKNNSYTPKYTNIDKSIAVKYPNLSDDHISLIVSLQSHARGLILRKHFAKNLKSKLEDHTYKEIDRFTKLFRTPTLIKAELNASNQFEPHGWTKYYPKDNNFFKFDYGFVLNTKLLVYDDVGVYFGQVNLDSFKHGQGTLLTKGGSKYQGSWRFNKFTGWGRHIDSDGNFYEGKFEDGKLTGKGEKYTLSGSHYIGEFDQGEKNGRGIDKTSEHVYEGEFMNDKKHGQGKLVYKAIKDSYEGEFTNNNITGFGLYTWANDDTYEGTFINGKMHGKGLYKWPDGGEYYGEYKNNTKEGFGKFKWSNGKVYEGPFVNGRPHGIGKLVVGGNSFEVEFINGKLNQNRRKA